MSKYSTEGISFYICAGKQFGGFGIRFDDGWRLTIGWISFALIFSDIEVLMGTSVKIIQEQPK